eukprot:365895-Chlamydomonas_euryale.AAC.12
MQGPHLRPLLSTVPSPTVASLSHCHLPFTLLPPHPQPPDPSSAPARRLALGRRAPKWLDCLTWTCCRAGACSRSCKMQRRCRACCACCVAATGPRLQSCARQRWCCLHSFPMTRVATGEPAAAANPHFGVYL